MEFYGITAHTLGSFGIEVTIMYILIIACVMMDLRSGIQKAKALGVYRSSRKLRDTINKLNKYFNAVVVFTIIDLMVNLSIACIGISVPHFPYMTTLASLLVGIIEVKSIYEKAEDKDRANVQDAARVLSYLLKGKDSKEIADKITEMLADRVPDNKIQ